MLQYNQIPSDCRALAYTSESEWLPSMFSWTEISSFVLWLFYLVGFIIEKKKRLADCFDKIKINNHRDSSFQHN